jgi:hypothetical protein
MSGIKSVTAECDEIDAVVLVAVVAVVAVVVVAVDDDDDDDDEGAPIVFDPAATTRDAGEFLDTVTALIYLCLNSRNAARSLRFSWTSLGGKG